MPPGPDEPLRYRLIDADGTDLGPFVSKRQKWKPGDRIGPSKGEDMLITAVIEPEDDVDFRAYLVVVRSRIRWWSSTTQKMSQVSD